MSPPRLPATHTPDERRGAERTPPAHSDPDLELPHERDQNLDATDPQPDPVIEQAARDLKQGQVDTDLRATPGLDAERRKDLLRKPR